MEENLKDLIDANSEKNRMEHALKWKREGKKVIGLLCSYIPEEVIHAAGMLPWRVTGTWRGDVSKASVYRIPRSRLYCTHVLESLLSGELDFLDGIIASDREQELVRLWDVWMHVRKMPFSHIMHIPHQESELGYQCLAAEIKRLSSSLESYGQCKISEESLRHSAETLNETRRLLAMVYELKKKTFPPLSGGDTLGVVSAATILPKEEFNQRLRGLLSYLQTRTVPGDRGRPRLLVSSDMLDNRSYLDLVESNGAIVAMDDLDPGSRYVWGYSDTDSNDIYYALARRYLTRPGCARMVDWDKQTDQIIRWVREFHVNGVLELPELYSYPCSFRGPFLAHSLREAGIPYASFSREYHFADAGQLGTRIRAFVEMLEP